MTLGILQVLLGYLVCIFAFEELIFTEGQTRHEMIDQGRIQYQLLKEKTNLPQYGSCWKGAVLHLDEGCKHISEEIQSDIALHITNCFLETSGHQTYNCDLDKKPNLRAICINSMTDRAFHVYTEFFTHTQNICWFLRGQIWQETISENTWKVGKQLELTALNQEGLLKAQKESLVLQEKMLKHGRNLEQVLESLHESSSAHKDILIMLSKSVISLQSWIIGEVSWIDSVVFYMISVFVIVLLTSSQRTLSSRMPISVLLFLNLLLERMICSYFSLESNDINILTAYLKIYDFVWYSRYAFVGLAITIYLYKFLHKTDIHFKNNKILLQIHDQNTLVLSSLDYLKLKLTPRIANETFPRKEIINEKINGYKPLDNSYTSKSFNSSNEIDDKFHSHSDHLQFKNVTTKKYEARDLENAFNNVHSNENVNNSYNLRSYSRQPTPSC